MKGIRTALRSLARIPFVEPLRGMDECGSGVFLEALCSYFQPNPVRGRGGVLPSSAIRVYWLLQSGARVRRWDLGPATRKPQRATTNDRGSLTLCEYGTWPIRRFFPSQFGTRGGIVMQPNFTAAGTHWIVGSAAVKFGCMTIPPRVPNCDEKNPLFNVCASPNYCEVRHNNSAALSLTLWIVTKSTPSSHSRGGSARPTSIGHP